MQFVYLAPLTAFTAALLVTWWLPGTRLAALTLDHPNRRSLHRSPVPRTGGIGLLTGVLLAAGLIAPGLPYSLWGALGVLFAISALNDVREIGAGWRLSAHLIAAGLFVAEALGGYGLLVKVAVLLALAWMSNLYNFMDGSDGLAGGMAVIGFSFYGAAATVAGDIPFALLNFSIAAAALAFLVFNFHPARVFMGDAGSVPLGFLAAALGTMGWLKQDWTWWFPLLVFSAFIADATVTLARRLLAGEKVWRAHRDHYYQRLVLLGWSHRDTALAEYALMLAVGVLALLALAAPAPVQVALICGVCAAYLAIIVAVSRRWRRRAAGSGS